MTTTSANTIESRDWLLLLILSLLWGGSFLFVGIAVKELPALLIVFARVGIAAAVLVPAHLILQGPLPRSANMWIAAIGMAFLNNVIPFTAIAYGQHSITVGLASVINATTPLFGAVIMTLAGAEVLTGQKIAGLLLGLAGVFVLRGLGIADLNQETLGILAVLLASASYGASSLWAKKKLKDVPPMTSATCQLLCSTVVMGLLVVMFADPAQYLATSGPTWTALIALAVISTSIAYLIFFRIIASAGPSVVLLVTMLIPVSAIVLGAIFLDERLSPNELIGTLMIGCALLVIDGRVLRWLGLR
jgi:drug/metabolite transporter (DMT)-like permease